MSDAIKQLIAQSHFDQAIEQAQQLLARAKPGQNTTDPSTEIRDLTYLLVVAYRLNNNIDQAITTAKQFIVEFPHYARGFQELAYCYLSKHQQVTLDAATHFYQAVKLNPALLASWQQLARYYHVSGNHQAFTLAQNQIQYLSQLPKPILGARDLMNEGDLATADRLCRQFLQQHKHHPEGMFLLAEIGIQSKAYSDAEFLLESCVTLYPEHKGAGVAYLQLLSKMGKFKQALALANTLLEKNTHDTNLQIAKATALVGVGDIEQAISLYQALLAQNPDQPGTHLLLGHALKAAGQLSSAITSYQQAYHYKTDFGDAYWSLANTKAYRFTDDEIKQMETCLTQTNLDQEDRVHLLFALGKAHEDRKIYEPAFHFYAQGNQLKSQSLGYQAEFIERQVDAQIAFFKPEHFSAQQDQGCQAADPIFIVGLPRSGSTLLEQILASHSQVEGTMELHNIIGMVSRLRGQGQRYPDVLDDLVPSYFKRFGEQYITETQVYRHNTPYFIDKMPNNFLHIGLIKRILPNAKIIDARRDPMACTFSCFKQLFGEGQEFTYDLDHLGRYYQAYLKLMAHWDQVLPNQILHVQHEDVVNDFENQVHRILDYCQLPFEASCLTFYNTERAVKTPSSEQVRQPIYKTGLAQWKHFEPWLTPLANHFHA